MATSRDANDHYIDLRAAIVRKLNALYAIRHNAGQHYFCGRSFLNLRISA